MSKYNIFNFKYGKEKKSIFYYAKLGLLFKGSIDLISLLPGIEKEKVFNLVDRIQLAMNIDILNDYIIKDDELIGYRIKRVVNEAIKKNEDQSLR